MGEGDRSQRKNLQHDKMLRHDDVLNVDGESSRVVNALQSTQPALMG